MDTKLYVEWRKTLGKWIVKYQGQVISQHDTQVQAEEWVKHHYPAHSYEIERVSGSQE